MKKTFLGACLLAGFISVLGYAVGKDWGYGAAFATSVYGVLMTVFLVAQIYGFVLSQVSYAENVENVKFTVLEAEGIHTAKGSKLEGL